MLPRAYGKPCPRCGEPMLKGQQLDAGHADGADPRYAVAVGMEHAYCNRAAGGRL